MNFLDLQSLRALGASTSFNGERTIASNYTCPSGADTIFGPQVDPACRPLDFTIYFEDLVFFCIPAAVFLLACPFLLWLLTGQKPVMAVSGLLYTKLLTLGSMIALQIAFSILRSQAYVVRNAASIAVDVLLTIAFTGAMVLTYVDHIRSVRPSTLLAIFFSLLSLLGLARIRSLWLIWTAEVVPLAVPVVASTVFALTVFALFLESTDKRTYIMKKEPGTSPEQFSGFWKRATFVWLAETFRQGYSTILSVEELPSLDPKLESHSLLARLEATWSKSDKKAKFGLFKSCLLAYIVPFTAAAIPRLCLTGFKFAQPFLINTTTTYIGLDNSDINAGHGIIGAYALVYTGMAVSTALYWYQTFRFIVNLRGGLIGLVHKQTMQARAIDLGEITAVTLMGTDIERIVSSFRQVHELWASIVEIGIGLWLLEQQVGAACVMPALIAVVFIGITFKISALENTSQRLWIEKVEERLKITTSMLGDMKAVKMLGLTDKMESILQNLREVEIKSSRVFRKLVVWEIFLSNSPLTLAPISTFIVFIIIALVQHSQTLLTSQAFTSLALVALMTQPVLVFIQAVPAIYQCIGCFDRIQEYCSVNSCLLPKSTTESSLVLEELKSDLHKSGLELEKTVHSNLISLRACNFAWKKAGDTMLSDITTSIEMNKTTVIIGPVGSGKSMLLLSMLGETLQVGGELLRNKADIAYCAQTPWLMNSTVRKNITGPLMFEEAWYRTAVWSCGLDEDLAQMAEGDYTNVGSNGVSISGGQKQRIALARAIYSRSKAILLDDVFSGMDTRTVALITSRLFGADGLFHRHGLTVVLTTHSNKFLPLADTAIVLEIGRISASGTLESLLAQGGYIARIGRQNEDDTDSTRSDGFPESKEERLQQISKATHPKERDPFRQNGDFAVYRYYANASGRRATLIFLLAMLLAAILTEFQIVWVKLWTDANTRSPNDHLAMYLGIYAFLAVAATVSVAVSCGILLIVMISKSSLHLHKELLQTTLRAPFRFFTTTDVGELTNRFSQDMELVGMEIPIMAANFTSAVCSCCVSVIILAIYAQYLGITLPFVMALIFFLQKFYLRTSRQVRLLDIEAKAPLYTHFLESVSGAITIRALGWQSRFDTTCHELLNTSQRPVYLLYCIQQWLRFVLDLIVAALAVILVSIVITWKDHFSAGSVGVSLIIVMTFNQRLMQLITSWTQLETSIGAVARVKAFVTTTESEAIPHDPEPLPKDWPIAGGIEFSQLNAFHLTPEKPAIVDLTLSVKPKEKVAICGRSGSGKTSLILSLLQMLQVDQGSIVIDGTDISRLSYIDLRSHVNVVPQDPFLMPGTIRFNMDPFETATDEEIISALEKVRLWSIIRDNGGLDKVTGMQSWSVGQRQLFCLARALVRKGKILILDEATSSVDHETEAIMQDIIDKEFAEHTVLAVMHRLGFVDRYDKVLLLDTGRMVEFDTPAALLDRPSAFLELFKASGYKARPSESKSWVLL